MTLQIFTLVLLIASVPALAQDSSSPREQLKQQGLWEDKTPKEVVREEATIGRTRK